MPRDIAADERSVELQAGAHEATRLAETLVRYDRAENKRHVLLSLFGDAEQSEIEKALIAGDRVEAQLLARLLVRVRAFEREAHLLAEQITALLEHHDSVSLIPPTSPAHGAPSNERGRVPVLTSSVDGAAGAAER